MIASLSLERKEVFSLLPLHQVPGKFHGSVPNTSNSRMNGGDGWPSILRLKKCPTSSLSPSLNQYLTGNWDTGRHGQYIGGGYDSRICELELAVPSNAFSPAFFLVVQTLRKSFTNCGKESMNKEQLFFTRACSCTSEGALYGSKARTVPRRVR